MDSLGLFDPELRLEGLVDPAFVIEGWYDPEMVGTGVLPPIPPTPTPTPPAKGVKLQLGSLAGGGKPALGPVLAVVNTLNLGRISGIRIGSPTVRSPRLGLGPLTQKPPQ